MNVNVVPNCESIVVQSPSGKSTTLDTMGNDICSVQLTETGTYTITVKLESFKKQLEAGEVSVETTLKAMDAEDEAAAQPAAATAAEEVQ